MTHELPSALENAFENPRPVWGEMAVVADPDLDDAAEGDEIGDEDILDDEDLPDTQPEIEPLPSTKDFADDDPPQGA